MRLTELIRRSGMNPLVVPPHADPEISGLSSDSRAVQPGFLFAALPGTATDGRAFIADAVARGAAAVLVGPGPLPDGLDPSVAVIVDPEPRRRLALMAAAFAGAQPRTMVAVTGTSGKSSTVHFTRELWSRLGITAASIGTLGIVSPTLHRDSGLTTPDPIVLHADLAALARSGVDHAAIEASSQRLASSSSAAYSWRRASGRYFHMKRSPWLLRRMPPSPRTPSVTRMPITPGGQTMPVGWNCRNSMSRRSAPAW